MGQAALQDAVSGNFTHVTGAEVEDLGSNGILLHQGLLQPQGVLAASSFCRHQPMLLQGLSQRWPSVLDPLQMLLASLKNEAHAVPAPVLRQ